MSENNNCRVSRFEALSRTAAGAAHGFNNILGSIRGFAEQYRRKHGGDKDAAKYSERILQACERGIEFSARLMSFSSKETGNVFFSLNDIIRDIKPAIESQIKTSIEIVYTIPNHNCIICGNKDKFRDAILNIALNSISSMVEGGILKISLTSFIGSSASTGDSVDNDHPFQIEITDTSSGLSTDEEIRFFDPLFVKTSGDVDGFAMAISYRTIINHGGDVSLQSAQGKGISILIKIPPSKTDISSNVPLMVKQLPSSGRYAPRLMIVDDDEMLIDMFREVMKELKISCHLFTNGADAVKFFAENHSNIDAIVIDMAMPLMSGKTLFYELRKINKDKPVIVLSGYSSSDDIIELTRQGAIHIIKPVSIEELVNRAGILGGLSPVPEPLPAPASEPAIVRTEIDHDAAIAIIDDDPLFGELLLDILKDYGLTASLFTDPRFFMESVDTTSFHFALVDYKMPHINGIDLIKRLKRVKPETGAVLITGVTGGDELFQEAEKLGITCLSKPLDTGQFKKILEEHFPATKETFSEPVTEHKNQDEMIVGTSVPIIRTRQLIKRVAKSEANLMIYGETGSGKELAARMIHAESQRSKEPFIPVNCPSLPDNLLESELFGYEKGAFTGAHQTKKGLFEWANKGTIFLDEIGDLNYILQAKILRAVQERKIRRVGGQDEIPVNVRIISATNKNLEEMIKAHAFREDLYYRLNVVKIVMPSLRDRRDDIPLLIRHFMHRFNKREGSRKITDVSLEAINMLKRHSWPGNVRELENTMNEVFILAAGNRVTVKDLPANIRQEDYPTSGKIDRNTAMPSLEKYMEDAKKDYLIAILKKSAGNVSVAAKESAINRASFHRLLSGFNINPDLYRHKK